MHMKQARQEYGFAAVLLVAAAILPLYMFSNLHPFAVNPYNSYALQAQAWLQGQLDLSANHPHLEIAIFEGRYYISFPPFPSVIMLPFAALFGARTPDNLIALGFALLSATYAYRLALHLLKDPCKAAFLTFFICAGSNTLHISSWGAVWYIAQNMAFAFTMMALYYAVANGRRHGMVSLFCLACAMGCRPFNMVYVPLLFLLLYKQWAENEPQTSFLRFAKWLMLASLPAIGLGAFYMLLNFLRFGSIFEFGHNYLPEFTSSPLGQFHLSYVAHNWRSIFVRLPSIAANGSLNFPMFDGVAFWLVSPIVLVYAVYTAASLLPRNTQQKSKADIAIVLAIPALALTQIFLTAMHKTLGGHHFGNRYTVDCLPFFYLGLLYALDRVKHQTLALCAPPALFGYAVNLYGSILFFGLY